MPAWKNITLSLPGKDLRIISDKILFIKRILSATIIDRLPEEKSDWFDQPDKQQSLTGKTHLIQLLVSATTESKDLVNSKEFIEGGWADGAKFLDQSVITNFMAQEHQVKWPA